MNKVSLKKLDVRGGKRIKKEHQNPESLLLASIWEKLGGAKVITDKLKMPYQSVINFRIRGRIPLDQVFNIAHVLDIPPWGLNYKQLSKMYPSDIPKWKDVVKSYELSKEVTTKILALSNESTFSRIMKDPIRKKSFDAAYEKEYGKKGE